MNFIDITSKLKLAVCLDFDLAFVYWSMVHYPNEFFKRAWVLAN